MFKEALAGIFCLFLFYCICKFLWKKNKPGLAALVAVVLSSSCLAGILYNAKVMYPDFYMDTVTGPYRYGTFSGNLFAYSDEFMFQDNILFPVLRNRTVLLDNSADFYEKFFSLYAKSSESIEISESSRSSVLTSVSDFDFSHEFSCIGIMDYVTDGIPQELTASFEEEIYPTIYIQTASLEDEPTLVVIMDSDYTLYVMGQTYYQNLTGGNIHA